MRRGSTARTGNEQAGSERGGDGQARTEGDGNGRTREGQAGDGRVADERLRQAGGGAGPAGNEARQADSEEGTVVGEMAALPYQAHLGELAGASLTGMSRRLPTLVGAAVRLAWRASRFDTTATVVLNLVAGVFTAYGLLATSGVLTALFAGGATPDRVRAALPSLALVAGAAALRSGLQAGAGWAQARLKPKVNRMVETRLFDLTMRVDLTAFDDTDFHDAMHRARQRGLY
jgi:ATP-binding cassette subfamily B protein/ATP-binding cassette subfamily C protein